VDQITFPGSFAIVTAMTLPRDMSDPELGNALRVR
jgi:hypothetical protein